LEEGLLLQRLVCVLLTAAVLGELGVMIAVMLLLMTRRILVA
jgi:hypothetical protein